MNPQSIVSSGTSGAGAGAMGGNPWMAILQKIGPEISQSLHAKDMNLWNAGLTGTDTLRKGLIGFKQKQEADQLAKSAIRPDYQVADALNAGIGMQEQMAYGDIPGMNRAEDNLSASVSNRISNVTDVGTSADALAAIQNLASSETEGVADLGATEAQMRQQLLNQLAGSYMQYLAPEQQKAWLMNKFQPYQQAAQAAKAMAEAGMRNVNAAWNTGIGGIRELKSGELARESQAVDRQGGMKLLDMFGGGDMMDTMGTGGFSEELMKKWGS